LEVEGKSYSQKTNQHAMCDKKIVQVFLAIIHCLFSIELEVKVYVVAVDFERDLGLF